VPSPEEKAAADAERARKAQEQQAIQQAGQLGLQPKGASLSGLGSAAGVTGNYSFGLPTGIPSWAANTGSVASGGSEGGGRGGGGSTDALALLREKDRLNREAEERAYKRFQEVSATTSPRATAAGIQADENAARAAAFARAKDQAGKVARSSLTSLREALATSGGLGSGYEAAATGGVLGGATGSLGDFTREQLIQDLDRSRQVSDRERAAGLTERGKGISRQQSLLGLSCSIGRGLS